MTPAQKRENAARLLAGRKGKVPRVTRDGNGWRLVTHAGEKSYPTRHEARKAKLQLLSDLYAHTLFMSKLPAPPLVWDADNEVLRPRCDVLRG